MSVLEMLEEMGYECLVVEIIIGTNGAVCKLYGHSRSLICEGRGDTLDAAVKACYDAWKESEK